MPIVQLGVMEDTSIKPALFAFLSLAGLLLVGQPVAAQEAPAVSSNGVRTLSPEGGIIPTAALRKLPRRPYPAPGCSRLRTLPATRRETGSGQASF